MASSTTGAVRTSHTRRGLEETPFLQRTRLAYFELFPHAKRSHYPTEPLKSTKVLSGKVYYKHELKSGRELARTLLLSLFDRN